MVKKRLISIIIALMLLLTLIPSAGFAQETVTLNAISSTAPGDSVSISGATTLDEVTLKVIRPNNTILYVDVASANNGTYTNTFKMPADAVTGEYIVVVGQGDIVATEPFTVQYSGGNGGGGGSGGTPASNTTTVTAANGGTFTINGATINLPANAVAADIKVTVEKVTNTTSLPMVANNKLISDVFEITKDKAGNFDKPVTITLPFDPSKVDTAKYDLGIFWFNTETNQWVKLDNVKVDLAAGKVSGDVIHFTKFAVLATEKASETVTFKDIVGHWAQDNINQLVTLGAITGYPDGTFKPDNQITRAEFATILVKAYKLQQQGGKVFGDTANHWAKGYVATAAASGIVSGYNATTFGPDDPITREQMAVMIVRAAKLQAASNGKNFDDSEQISSWAKSAVAAASANNIIGGYPDNTFKPKNNATRAEAVTVIVKALK